MTRTFRTFLRVAALLALPCACIGDVDLGETGESGSGSASGSSSSDDDGASATTAGASTDTGGADETGAVTPEQSCAAYCAHEAMCEAADPSCVDGCLEMITIYDGVDAGCDAAMEQLVGCAGALPDCAFDPCAVPALAVGQCEALYGCGTNVMGQIGQPGCVWEMMCDILDETRVMACDDAGCTCVQDGSQIADCTAPSDLCDSEFPTGFVTECCGWLDPFGEPI